MDDVMRKAFQRWFNSRSIRHFDTAFEAGWNAALRGLERGKEPVARSVVAWVRPTSDGRFEGPLFDWDKRMDDVRRTSGVWRALTYADAPPADSGTVQVPVVAIQQILGLTEEAERKLTEARREGMEEAAKVCDESEQANHKAMMDQTPGSVAAKHFSNCADTARYCAAAIRAAAIRVERVTILTESEQAEADRLLSAVVKCGAELPISLGMDIDNYLAGRKL